MLRTPGDLFFLAEAVNSTNKFYSVSDKSARVYFLYSFLGGETMRFFSYGRKSVFSDKSDSIDNQFRMNREYCESKFSGQVDSWQQFSDEDFTGANTSRPDLQRMLSFIKGGFCDVLVVYQLDRLSRDVRDFANIYALL